MNKTLLGISQNHLYLHGEKPRPIHKYHHPYFLAFCPKNKNIHHERKKLIEKIEQNQTNNNDGLSKIKKIGNIEKYHSFWNQKQEKKIFKVYTKKSYYVPQVTDELFFNHSLYTAEHDIPYHQRALVDLAATNKKWMFDTQNEKKSLQVLVYDIETTQYEEGKTNVPIDIIGFSDFQTKIQSHKNLENEEFSFDIKDIPSSWKNQEVQQLVANNIDEEIENLHNFCKTAMNYDIISGHNILGFDNLQIYNRIKWILKKHKNNLSKEKKQDLKNFTNKYCRMDNSFHFGTPTKRVQIYPSSLDTYLGARKFYTFLNDYSLKNLAPFLGVKIKDRIVLSPSQLKIDDRTLRYNKQDVQEQLGVTLSLIQQALPLAFTTCMPFYMLFTSGAVNMWDHMSLIRGGKQRKIMPPISRVKSLCKQLLDHGYQKCENREQIAEKAKKEKDQISKGLNRIVKYGDEMPKWATHPEVIYNTKAEDKDETLNYHMPGGMTIKPDGDANSHFIPWWYVVVADVGAMYPTILKAMNIGADTIRLAEKNEEPDDWIWLKQIPESFLKQKNVRWRKITEEDSYADEGYMLAIKIDDQPGVVNQAMTGIMSMISKIKKELKENNEDKDEDELKRLKMMYQSVKGARNAGTHGIISAPTVSGRQFNLWGAASITTKGQKILSDSLDYLKKKDIRVVYGDSVDAVTDVIIRERGLIKIVNIKDLFENSEGKTQIKQKHEYKNLEGIECLSVDKNGFYDWKPAVFIKRHRFDDDIVNVKTQRGNISVTKNHSLYTLSKGLKTIYCKDIVEKKSKIVHLSHVKNEGRDTIINALDPLLSFDGELNIWVNIPLSKKTKHLLKHHQPRNNYKGGKSKKKYIRMKIQTAIELYKRDIIRDTDLKEAKISSYNGKGKIPVLYKMDEDFARLIGAYTAEGSLYFRRRDGIAREGAHIFVCGHEKEYLERIKNAAENIFEKKFRITHSGNDKNGDNFRIQGNSATAYIFKYVLDCGEKSNGKKISPFVLSAKKSIQKAFFEEYVNGDGYYDKRKRVTPLLEITSRSENIIEGMSLLSIMLGYGIPSVDYREDKKAYRIRIVQYNKDSTDYNDVSGIEVKKIKQHKPTDGYVYDISVDKNNNFVSANGLMLAHNTDGIYLGCSRSMGNVSGFAEDLGLKEDVEEKEEYWLSKPDTVLESIEKCNQKWREELNYPDFELEPEFHNCMIFVKHKNYLIFDKKNGRVEMKTKGNNFKGSDKPDIARKALREIMLRVLKDNPVWEEEQEARDCIKNSIVREAKDVIADLDLSKVDLKDLTLVQSVQPPGRYKPNQDGSMSTFGQRAAALEKLLGRRLKTRSKFRFVVTKQALPGIPSPSKSSVKPIDYMYPVDLLEDKREIDLDWYKEMIENYIKGAFGLSDMSMSKQTGLDSWM